jgi:primosomal protein N' (replication factor Y)
MTPQRARVLEIAREGFALRRELAQAAGVGTPVVKAMAKDGALETVQLPALRPFALPDPECRSLRTLAGPGCGGRSLRAVPCVRRATSVTLLDGVTGSGKTEVYFEAMAAALRQEKQVLLLLPEIALTACPSSRVSSAAFGVRTGAMAFRPAPTRARAGVARRGRWLGEDHRRRALGAVPAMGRNLGLIIVDEEHEGAYKQDEGVHLSRPRHGGALWRAGAFPCHPVIGHAVARKSLVNVDRGRYASVKLKDRHGRPELPEIASSTCGVLQVPRVRGSRNRCWQR